MFTVQWSMFNDFRIFAAEMKKFILIIIAAVALFSSCNDYETYGDKKEKERNAIAKFIADSAIVVISEDQFNQQNQTTDLSRNEFVKLDKTGVYMQIVRKGCGTPIQDGEIAKLVCRFMEYDIMSDTCYCRNDDPSMMYGEISAVSIPDMMNVTRTNSTYTAAFTSGVMNAYHGASVPSGWIVPFSYVKVGRPQSKDEECAKVRLIVPHSQGHADASSNVKPFYYVITFEREA